MRKCTKEIVRSGACALAFALAFCASSFGAGPKIHLAPRFSRGEVFRYTIQMRVSTTVGTSGLIRDPEGAKALSQSAEVTLRLEVLNVTPDPAGEDSVRLRAMYERTAVTTKSDSFDPGAQKAAEQFKKLQGHSIEFTLRSDGKISDVQGLKEILADPSHASMVTEWLTQLTVAASAPRGGIAIGDKWRSETPLDNVPLDGLAWKTETSYLRNEPCPAASASASGGGAQVTPVPGSSSVSGECAVILTKSQLTGGRGSKDRTPQVLRQNGLRSIGEWTGTSESLASVSLRTGMVESVTQSASTHMNFIIMTATAQNRMRFAGDTQNQSQITLISQSAAP